MVLMDVDVMRYRGLEIFRYQRGFFVRILVVSYCMHKGGAAMFVVEFTGNHVVDEMNFRGCSWKKTILNSKWKNSNETSRWYSYIKIIRECPFGFSAELLYMRNFYSESLIRCSFTDLFLPCFYFTSKFHMFLSNNLFESNSSQNLKILKNLKCSYFPIYYHVCSMPKPPTIDQIKNNPVS